MSAVGSQPTPTKPSQRVRTHASMLNFQSNLNHSKDILNPTSKSTTVMLIFCNIGQLFVIYFVVLKAVIKMRMLVEPNSSFMRQSRKMDAFWLIHCLNSPWHKSDAWPCTMDSHQNTTYGLSASTKRFPPVGTGQLKAITALGRGQLSAQPGHQGWGIRVGCRHDSALAA